MTSEPVSNIPCVSIEKIKNSSTEHSMSDSHERLLLNRNDSNVKKQFVIEDVGHFKFFRNNTIVIYFVDKIKLFMDEQSLEKFLANESDLVFISDLYATLYGGLSVNNVFIIPRRAPVSNL